MQFTIARDAVIDTISHVARRAKRSSIPILEHILLTAVIEHPALGDRLSLGGHDGQSSSSGDMAADITEAGSCVVPGEQFMGIVERMAKGSHIKFKFDSGETQAEISSGRSRYKLSTLPAHDFPPLLEPKAPATLHLDAGDIATLFTSPALVIEEDQARINFSGLFFHSDDNGMLAGCGASKATLIKVSTDTKWPKGAPSIIIPLRAIAEILKTVGDHGGDFSWSDKILQVKSGEWTYATKLIDAQFPDYVKFLPAMNGHFIKVETGALRSAIHRLQAIEANRSFVQLQWEAGATELSAHLNGNGEGGEFIECEAVEMDAGTIAISASDLMSIATALDGKSFTMHIQSAKLPFRVSADDRPNAVIMQAPIVGPGAQ